MINPSIRETFLTPKGDGGYAVELHISDAAPGHEHAAFDLKLHVEIPPSKSDRLLLVQREALKAGSQVLRNLVKTAPGRNGAMTAPPTQRAMPTRAGAVS